jgi:indolepyruvate ferredoxin oxidoreductase, beta subunit
MELILCGRGGQGVVFLTRVIGQIAAAKGLDVVSSETHGMAVRGGSINSHLRIGPFFSPLVRQGHADLLVSLDRAETANNRHFLKAEGLIVENSSLGNEAGIHRIDATRLARDIGRVQLENVVLVGFASRIEGFPVSGEELHEYLARDPRSEVRQMNLRALEAGLSTE